MELKSFVATHVSPGQPLTAQAWNDVIDAIDGVHTFIAATLHTVRVRVTTPGLSPGMVRVTALREGAPPQDAVAPVAPDTHHVLVGLEPGAYTIRGEALAFAPGTVAVTVGDSETIETELSLSPSGAVMPDLFGLTLSEARKLLGERSIALDRLIDFTGRDLPPQNPGPEFEPTPVLVQNPSAGVVVAPGGAARLGIAVAVRQETTIEVPSLAGMTQAEARKALEGLGLILGKVTILQK